MVREMTVTNVLQSIRVNRGILRDKLGMSKEDWQIATNKYQWEQAKEEIIKDSI